jgi:hypothetical protein
MKISFDDFRIFHHSDPIEIKPITILVGANSSGKSSFLAGIRYLFDILLSGEGSFNKEPFFLGTYDQIAHYRGGRFGRATCFKMRLEYSPRDMQWLWHGARTAQAAPSELPPDNGRIIELTFEDAQSQPALVTVRIVIGSIEVSRSRKDFPTIRLKYDGTEKTIESKLLSGAMLRGNPAAHNEFFWLILSLQEWMLLQPSKIPDDIRSVIIQMTEATLSSRIRTSGVYASSPIRTEPQRTYSPIEAVSSAEGVHIPMLLAQMKSFDSKKWTSIRKRLISFGRQSGLFQEIDVKRLGSNSDPFQLMITVSKVRSNIVDVGYGISQALPIVVELLMNENCLFFLFQQPEVHLHPSAQAELGSFFLEHALRAKKTIILETHSDYIVDRIRSDIVRSNQKPSDILSLLYFEKGQFETIIHPIEVDDSGQIINPPPGYRTFFMKESLRVLGLD